MGQNPLELLVSARRRLDYKVLVVIGQYLFNLLSKLFFSLGILYGTMTLELGGTVNITCEKTGYSAILEFKLKVSRE